MNYPAAIAAKRALLAELRATRAERHSPCIRLDVGASAFLQSIRRLEQIVELQPALLMRREAKASARRFDSPCITGFDGLMELAS